MLLLFLPQGPAVALIDLRDMLSDLYPLLNAAGAADLVEWSESDLYEWSDEFVKRLARTYGVFVERDTATAIVLATAEYVTPARFLSMIHVSAGSKSLYPVTVQELEALDADWPATQDVTESFLLDANGLAHVRVYPKPDATVTGALAQIFHRYPATLNIASYTLAAPEVIRDLVLWHVLAEARRRQSDAQMMEVAEHFTARGALMERAIESYWGNAQ